MYRQTALPLITAAVLTLSGCVSVQSQPPPVLTRAVPAVDGTPASLSGPPRPHQAPPREQLAAVEPVETTAAPTGPEPDEKPPARPTPRLRQRTTGPQPAHRPAHHTTTRQRTAPHSPPARRPPPPRSYDMQALCRYARGTVSPAVTTLCQQTYGH